jgi:hypothetical protein
MKTFDKSIQTRVFAVVRSCVVDDKEGWTQQVRWRGSMLQTSRTELPEAGSLTGLSPV